MTKAIIACLMLEGLFSGCTHLSPPAPTTPVPAAVAPAGTQPATSAVPVAPAVEPVRPSEAAAAPLPPAPEPSSQAATVARGATPGSPTLATRKTNETKTVVQRTAPSKAAPSLPKPAAVTPAEPQPVTAPPALNLAALEQRLRDTRAIGVFTKLSLKNQVDDLLDQFRAYYRGRIATPLADLRQRYDLLMLKVISLLQDSDPPLATDIVASREAIWGILRDPEKFATI